MRLFVVSSSIKVQTAINDEEWFKTRDDTVIVGLVEWWWIEEEFLLDFSLCAVQSVFQE